MLANPGYPQPAVVNKIAAKMSCLDPATQHIEPCCWQLTLDGLNPASAPATWLPKVLQALHEPQPETPLLVRRHTTGRMKTGLRLPKA